MRLYILLSILICLITFSHFRSAKAEIDVNLIVQGCNNNTICEPVSGEDLDSCPNDCTPLPPPPSSPAPTHTGGTAQYFTSSNFLDFKINYGDNSVTLSWSTPIPTQSIIAWGMSEDYAKGMASEIGYVKNHTTNIISIIPGKQYFFNIKAKDAYGNVAEYYGTFLLPPKVLKTRPQNVGLFRSFSASTGIGLRWVNPTDPDFAYVRIIRSDKEYPPNPLSGKIVYEGRGQSFVDITVKENVPYYYAAFVKDYNNVYSSGALLVAAYYTNGVTPLDSDIGYPYGKVPSISEKPIEFVEDSGDIEFIQNNEKISFTGNNIPILNQVPLIVTFPKGELSEAFIVIYGGDGGSDLPILVYLMRVNPETGRLEADVPGLNLLKPVNFSIYVLKNRSVNTLYQGIFDLHGTTTPVVEKSTEFFINILIICLFLILLFISLLTLKRIFK